MGQKMNKDIIVVGSVAFDDIETIKGRHNRLLGGSGVYFSLASSLFTKTHLIGIVGDDFNQDDIEMLHAKSISTNYLVHEKGKTFSWGAKYEKNWDKKMSEDLFWPDIKKLMNNYQKFLTMPKERCKIVLINLIKKEQ